MRSVVVGDVASSWCVVCWECVGSGGGWVLVKWFGLLIAQHKQQLQVQQQQRGCCAGLVGGQQQR